MAPAPMVREENPATDVLALRDALARAEREYEEHGEPADLEKLFDDTCVVTAARSEQPQPTDVSFAKKRLFAIYAFAGRTPMHVHFRHENDHVTVQGDRVTVRWKAVIERERIESTAAFEQLYELARVRGHYRVVKFRYWPLLPDTLREFGADYFAEIDAKVETARRAGDDRLASYWLVVAYRFDEAHELAERLPAAGRDTWTWNHIALTRAMVGDLAGAEAASSQAKAAASN